MTPVIYTDDMISNLTDDELDDHINMVFDQISLKIQILSPLLKGGK